MDDIEAGAISFHPSVAINQEETSQAIFKEQFSNKMEEAEGLVAQVVYLLENYPQETIAILVRSRSQLPQIVSLLRAKNIPFQGVEIEKLSNLPHLLDIWSLTKALLLPADRLSWLSLLRSPWCGIMLTDLYQIANFNPKKSIYFALENLSSITNLSEDGRLRAQFIYSVMHHALNTRYQQALNDWILDVLKHLHKDALLDTLQQASLEQFFMLLSRFSKEGQLVDILEFEKEFSKLYSEHTSASRLQIMTIHKSKGLEFDSVILPGLGSKTRKHHKPLLRWLTVPTEQQDKILISPIHPFDEKKCPLYDFLSDLATEKEDYEQQRLLYVAVTRAKKRLYLLDYHEKIAEGSFRAMLPAFDIKQGTESSFENALTLPLLSRLSLSFYESPIPFQIENNHLKLPTLINQATRVSGIIAHELMQWLCDKHVLEAEQLPWTMVANRFKSAGFASHAIEESCNRLKTQMTTLLESAKGRWLCQAHQEEHNEYALLVKEEEQILTRIIDRTFIDNNIRYIIDFKTGKDDLLSEEKHRKQVNEYAKILASQSQPIRCVLLYLVNNRWVEWDWLPKNLPTVIC